MNPPLCSSSHLSLLLLLRPSPTIVSVPAAAAAPPVQVVPTRYQGLGVTERVRCHVVAGGFDRYALQVRHTAGGWVGGWVCWVAVSLVETVLGSGQWWAG